MFSLPGKHRVVGLLLFLLVLLTHIQRGQVDSQQLSDALPAVDVAVLVQNLEEASQVNLPYRLASNGPQDDPPPYLSLDKFVPIVVWEGAVNRDWCLYLLIKFNVRKSLCRGLRRVEDQSVPLALDVVVLRLLGDVETIKLQLPRKFFLPLEDHQWDLHKRTNGRHFDQICS